MCVCVMVVRILKQRTFSLNGYFTHYFTKNKMLIEKIQINTNSITATFNTGGNYISINMTGVRRACGDAEIGRPVLLSDR